MWSSELYVKELMNMKRRLEILEEKRWYEGNKVNKIVEFKSKLEGENKTLNEQTSSMQGKIEVGQQEVANMKQEPKQLRMSVFRKSEVINEEEEIIQLQGIQARLQISLSKA